MAVTIAYTQAYQKWQLGDDHPTNPIRAELAVKMIQADPTIEVMTLEPKRADIDTYAFEAITVHDDDYVARVRAGNCGEWAGTQPELGETALLMFGGTVMLVDEVLDNIEWGTKSRVFFNPQGAKHHAQYERSSGFCVFNDMAYAAKRLTDEKGLKVVYVDWDAHHGDGVENILKSREDILTISVHDSTAFPWTGSTNGGGFMNYPMPDGAGDTELRKVVDDIRKRLLDEKPEIILLACGADGLAGDPLTSLMYTQEGLEHAARMIGSVARQLQAEVLIGGAGGYQPFDEVPEHWYRCVKTIDRYMNL